jgi:hypothetical protein
MNALKQCVIYAREYYSAINNEVLSFAGKWMELKIIILSEVSQVEKDKGHIFLSYVEDRSKYEYKHYHIYI